MNTRKHAVALSLAAALVSMSAHANLVVDPLVNGTVTPEALMSALLSPNSGMVVSNIGFVGNTLQAGTFGGGKSAGLGFDSGVVLSTDWVAALSLVGASEGADTNMLGAGDSRLDLMLNARTHDAAVLRFDFVPDRNRISLTYVFGSTEYNNFVDTHFDDAFAAFVNGRNVALVPGTSSPITINQLNCGASLDIAPGVGPNCGQFIDNRKPNFDVGQNLAINLGGFSKTFTLIADVTPNALNSMYLVLGDTRDGTLDSAVFIAGGTLTTVPEPGTLQFAGCALATMLLLGWHKRSRQQRADLV